MTPGQKDVLWIAFLAVGFSLIVAVILAASIGWIL